MATPISNPKCSLISDPPYRPTILGKMFGKKIEKPRRTGQQKKSLISTFACFLTAIAKV